MSTAAQYVVAAYAVVLFGLVMYAVVVGLRSARLAREAELLALLVERREAAAGGSDASVPELESADA